MALVNESELSNANIDFESFVSLLLRHGFKCKDETSSKPVLERQTFVLTKQTMKGFFHLRFHRGFFCGYYILGFKCRFAEKNSHQFSATKNSFFSLLHALPEALSKELIFNLHSFVRFEEN